MMENKKKIFIIGSKPDIIYPKDVKADLLVGVNAAVSRIQNFENTIEKHAIISNYVFTNKDDDCIIAYERIKDCKVDKLYITANETVDEDSKKRLHNSSLSTAKSVYLSEKELNIIKNRYFSYLDTFKNYGFYGLYKFIKYNLKKEKNKYTHISTGMLALAVILEIYKDEPLEIYLLGIGIDPNSGHFYDEKHLISNYHLEKDLIFLKNVVRTKKSLKLYATDKQLSDYLENNR